MNAKKTAATRCTLRVFLPTTTAQLKATLGRLQNAYVQAIDDSDAPGLSGEWFLLGTAA